MWQAVSGLKDVGLTYEADNEELQVTSDADKKATEKQAREDTTSQANDNTKQKLNHRDNLLHYLFFSSALFVRRLSYVLLLSFL